MTKRNIYERLPLSRPMGPLDMPQATHEPGSVLLAENEKLASRIRELEAEVARLKSPDVVLAETEGLLREVDAVGVWVCADGVEVLMGDDILPDGSGDLRDYASLAEAYAALRREG